MPAPASLGLFAASSLGRDEVRRLVRNGSDKARNQLVLANMRLVAMHARKYAHSGLDLDDLIQQGTIGLIRASEKFDPDRDVAFSTYASFWIRQAISRIADERTVTVAHNVRTDVSRVGRVTRALTQTLGRPPTDEELLKATGFRVGRLENVKAARLAQAAVSLASPVDAFADHEVELIETIADQASLRPLEEIVCEMDVRRRCAALRRVLRSLDPRDREVISFRFGLSGGPCRTLDWIADRYGLSRERVRQIESQAISRLRAAAVRRALKKVKLPPPFRPAPDERDSEVPPPAAGVPRCIACNVPLDALSRPGMRPTDRAMVLRCMRCGARNQIEPKLPPPALIPVIAAAPPPPASHSRPRRKAKKSKSKSKPKPKAKAKAKKRRPRRLRRAA